MTPRVSVIVPAFNAAETLPATLESVRAQTVADWEVVLVDDGSTDGTAELAAAFDPRVRVLRNERSVGPGAARNRAIREARAPVVAMLDADDRWLPRYLESQLAALGGAAAVCCDAQLVNADGVLGLWSEHVGRVERVDVDVLLRENVVFGLVTASRDALLAVGGYEEDRRLGVEDYDLWLRLAERGYEIAVNPEVLAVYQLGPSTRSGRVGRMAAGAAMMLDRALDRGALTPAQARAARRRRRMFRVVERRARIAAEPSRSRRLALAARAAPAIVVSALEHPERWRHWLARGPRTAGADRHVAARR